jgi:hypothetical protein
MSGEQAAGGGVGMNPGDRGEGGAWGLLHLLAGHQVRVASAKVVYDGPALGEAPT